MCGDIRKSRCTTGINDTGSKFATSISDTFFHYCSFASVVDTFGKFATGVNDTGSKICHWCQRRRWQIATGINDTSSKFATGVNNTGGKQWEQFSNCWQLKMSLKKVYQYANSTTQKVSKETMQIFLVEDFFH